VGEIAAEEVDTSTVGTQNAVLDANSGWGTILIPYYIRTTPHCPDTSAGGSTYNMDPAGDILGDQGAGVTTFINHGQGNDHQLYQ
jgi:hypothetical protein